MMKLRYISFNVTRIIQYLQVMGSTTINMLGKSGLVFPKLINVTIHRIVTHNGNTQQNTDIK